MLTAVAQCSSRMKLRRALELSMIASNRAQNESKIVTRARLLTRRDACDDRLATVHFNPLHIDILTNNNIPATSLGLLLP